MGSLVVYGYPVRKITSGSYLFGSSSILTSPPLFFLFSFLFHSHGFPPPPAPWPPKLAGFEDAKMLEQYENFWLLFAMALILSSSCLSPSGSVVVDHA